MSGKYALVIGNTEYTDSHLAKLTAPGKDANEFARVLKDQKLCGFDEVRVLLNQFSTSVMEAIDEFFDQRKPDDLLVLYFSGHGVRDDLGSLYLAVKNTVRSRLLSTAIESEYIKKVMDRSRSKRQVLILDCCNSGAFPQGTKAEAGGAMGLMTAFQGYGRYVLTASDATQYAWEGDKVIGSETENSLFTHFLVKGLEGEADSEGDGKITVDKLYDYAFEQVSKVMLNQTPTKSSSKAEGEIILRQITRMEDIKPVALSDDLIGEMEDIRPLVREGAVQRLVRILNGKNIGLQRSAIDALEKIVTDENTTRRVAQLAAQALDAFQQVGEKLEAAQEAEQERLAREKLEAERKAEAERQAKIEADRLAAQKTDQEQLKREKAKPPSHIDKKVVDLGRFKPFNFPLLQVGIGVAALVIIIAFVGFAIKDLIPWIITPTPIIGSTSIPIVSTSMPVIGSTSIPIISTTMPGIASTMVSDKDGMILVYVLAGNFTMGSDKGGSNEMPVHSVYLDAFWIDKTDVTNKMYALCVDDGRCQPPRTTKSATRTSYYGNSQYDDYPVIYVDWNMAETYCEWVGRQLPTEAEWEKAARGTDGRTYPWGNDPPNNNLLNNNQSIGDTTEVGEYPNGASPYGALDMAGNVWQWVADWYDAHYYSSSPSSNPLGPTSGQYRVQRGGEWDSNNGSVRSTGRSQDYPLSAYNHIGFRCSLSASP
jgi:formylglycine-generating enzyme required for sulfatase activity